MKFVRAIWKLLVGIKDALVLLLLILFFGGLYGVLSAKPAAVREGVLDLNLNGSVVEQPSRREWAEAVACFEKAVERAALALETPAARLTRNGVERSLLLEEVETVLASEALIVDACRGAVRHRGVSIALATRPVLFALARALGEAWPNEATRD